MQNPVAFYTSPKGKPVTFGSYSQREVFRRCPQEFKLARVDGWKSKRMINSAAIWFGKAIETAMERFENHGRPLGSAMSFFEVYWNKVKELKQFPKFEYSASEGSWEALLLAGREMMLLYEIRLPQLPISVNPKSRFQVSMNKKLFPGSELNVLQNTAKIDILSYPVWNHPMLVPIEQPERAHRLLGIDIKATGEDYDPELIHLDGQLREYAWQSRVQDWALLWFVKRSHSLEKGTRVTLLNHVGGFKAGAEVFILGLEKQDDLVLEAYVGDGAALDAYEKATKNIRGKLLDTAKASFFQTEFVVKVVPAAFTKQRLQFATTRLSDEDMDETGRMIAVDTVEMVRANETGFYPKVPGIRFPNQKCKFCDMRGICLGKPELRDAMLTRDGEEWLDGE